MGRKSKLTPQQWAAARRRWEGCDRGGFEWLRLEMLAGFGVAPSRPAIQQAAAEHGWKKGGEPSQPIPPHAPTTVDEPREKVTGRPDTLASEIVRAEKVTRIEKVDAEPVDLLPGEKPPGYAGTGRPSRYRPEYDKMIVDYFDRDPYTTERVEQGNGLIKLQRIATDLPMLVGFAKSIGTSVDAVTRWAKETTRDGALRYPSFAESFAHARDLQASVLARGAALGLYESRFLSFAMKNLHGWMDQPTHTVAPAPVSAEELERLYGSRMKAARERQAALRAQRAHLWADDEHESPRLQ